MSSTAHASAGRSLAANMQATAEGREELAYADQWLRDPANATLRAIYGDPYRGWDSGQVAALSKLIAAGMLGKFRIVNIPLGVSPSRDSAREANRDALANLPCGITAEVYDGGNGRGSESDGHLTIPDGLDAVDEDGSRRVADGWRCVPIEIGHTDATRTYMHLAQEGAVARWPYGHDRIYVVTTTPAYSMTPGIGLPPLYNLGN